MPKRKRLTAFINLLVVSALLAISVTGTASNRLSVTEADGSSTHWAYDDAYRLINERRYDSNNAVLYNAHFTYDPAGNRLSQNIHGVTTNYTYNELDQLLTAGSTQYQYDPRGNLTSAVSAAGTIQYGYDDAQDRLTSVTLPDGTNIANTYDYAGRRVKQVIGTQTTNYLWDELSPYGDVILETDNNGRILASYTLAGTELVSQSRNGATSYYLQDGQGSARTLTNSVGSVTDTYAYTAFGEMYSQTGTTDNSYLFAGQQFDSETSLYSLRARYYDPSSGRFLSQDAYPYNIGNPVELNRYTYAGNNPVNFSDPSGNQAFAEYAINIAKTDGAYGVALFTYTWVTNSPVIVGALLAVTAGTEAYHLYSALVLGDQDAAFLLITGYQLVNYSYSALVALWNGIARYSRAIQLIIMNRVALSQKQLLSLSRIAQEGGCEFGICGGFAETPKGLWNRFVGKVIRDLTNLLNIEIEIGPFRANPWHLTGLSTLSYEIDYWTPVGTDLSLTQQEEVARIIFGPKVNPSTIVFDNYNTHWSQIPPGSLIFSKDSITQYMGPWQFPYDWTHELKRIIFGD